MLVSVLLFAAGAWAPCLWAVEPWAAEPCLDMERPHSLRGLCLGMGHTGWLLMLGGGGLGTEEFFLCSCRVSRVGARVPEGGPGPLGLSSCLSLCSGPTGD